MSCTLAFRGTPVDQRTIDTQKPVTLRNDKEGSDFAGANIEFPWQAARSSRPIWWAVNAIHTRVS